MSEQRLRWPNWPDHLKKSPRTRIVAYWTLINEFSLRKTMPMGRVRGPVRVKGVRRVYDFALVDENYVDRGGPYERSEIENHCATLNVEFSGEPRDAVNGILLLIEPDEVSGFAQREYGYDLLPVEYEQAGATHSALMFTARRESEAVGDRVRDDILPNESCLKTCLLGANAYGQDFLETWIASCHLADGTPLREDTYYDGLVSDHLHEISGASTKH